MGQRRHRTGLVGLKQGLRVKSNTKTLIQLTVVGILVALMLALLLIGALQRRRHHPRVHQEA